MPEASTMDGGESTALARQLVDLYGRIGAAYLAVSKMNAHLDGGDVSASSMWARVVAECGRAAAGERGPGAPRDPTAR